MSEDNLASEESRQLLSLGRREPDIPQGNVWKDDALSRSEVAEALSSVGSPPLLSILTGASITVNSNALRLTASDFIAAWLAVLLIFWLSI